MANVTPLRSCRTADERKPRRTTYAVAGGALTLDIWFDGRRPAICGVELATTGATIRLVPAEARRLATLLVQICATPPLHLRDLHVQHAGARFELGGAAVHLDTHTAGLIGNRLFELVDWLTGDAGRARRGLGRQLSFAALQTAQGGAL